MAKLSVFASFTVIIILTLLFVNCTEDSPTTPSIDFVAPYVEWVNPFSSAELSGTAEFSFSVYEENGIDSVKVYINGALFVGEIPPFPPFAKGGMSDLTSFKKGGKATSNTVAPLCKGEINDIAPPFSKGETPKSVFPISKGETGIVSPFCKGGIKGGFYFINSSDTTITIEWNTLDYEDGVYILEARAWDTSGNMGISPSLMVNIKNNTDPSEDRFPPMIVWVSPEASSEISGDVTLRFNAMDNIGIDSLKLYVNGACPEGYTLQGQQEIEYSIVWTTEDFEDGVYILEARAWDTSGNLGVSPALMVNVKNETDPPPEDKLAPYVHWIAPEGGSTLKDTVSLQVGLYDENGIDSVKIYINGTLIMGSADASPPATAEPVLAKAGRKEQGGVTLSVFESTSAKTSCLIRKPPLYSPLLCRGDDYTNTDEVVSHFCTDENACTTSPFSKGETPKSVFPISKGETGIVSPFCKGGIKGGFYLISSPSDTTITTTWNTLDYEDGVYILEARAWDTSGNLGTSPSLMVNVKNNEEPPPEDRTPPVVSWVSPEPGTEVDGLVELQFDALDNIGIDNIKVYINGALPVEFTLAGQDNEERYSVSWHTQDYADGVYIVEVRAFDSAGNVGSAPTVSFTVLNYPPREPRVIWVPDDYEKIQDAINASEDGDTIIVRAGEYREQLQFFDKNISLISESGPEVTIIDGTDCFAALRITGGQDTTIIIRGFKFVNNSEFEGICLLIGGGASPKIVNNIFTTPSHDNAAGIYADENNCSIRNNFFVNIGNSIEIHMGWGDFSNNMIVEAHRYGFYNRTNYAQPLVPDYNLFWDFHILVGHQVDMVWGDNNITDQEPLFIEGSYRLREGSPGIDQGRPDLRDPDGSRSDIGVYGGPYAY